MIYGRDHEQSIIQDCLDLACAGSSRVLMLRGEPGVGKTALLTDAMSRARGMRLVSCSGLESESELAFSGLQHLLASLFDEMDVLPASQAGALRAALGLSELPVTEFLVCAAVHSLLTHAARERPLLVVIDDAHWLDRASLRALYFTARRLAADPITILFGFRQGEEGEPQAPDLPVIDLSGLSTSAANDLLDELEWAAPGRDSLIAATAGNPLALKELTKLSKPDRLVSDVALFGTVPLSERLGNAFLERVANLPLKIRRLFVVIAVEETGRPGVIVGVAERLGIDRSTLIDAGLWGTSRELQRLSFPSAPEWCDLLERTSTRVTFAHPIMRSAVYQQASFQLRSSAHLAVAEELTSRGEAHRAAWHRAVAAVEPDEELAEALERSAETTERRGGSAAVASVLQRAARLSADACGRIRRITTAAFAAWQSGQPDLARVLADQAESWSGDKSPRACVGQLRGLVELDSSDAEMAYHWLFLGAEKASTEAPMTAIPLFVMAVDAGYLSGRLDRSARVAERMSELACAQPYREFGRILGSALDGCLPVDGTTPAELLAEAPPLPAPYDAVRHLWVMAVSWLGPHQRLAREFGATTCREFRSRGVASVLPVLLGWVADLDYHLGRWAEGIEHAEEALRCARDTGQHSRACDALALLARFAAVRGDWDDCHRYSEQALQTALLLRNRAAAARASWARGLAALVQGDDAEAYRRLSPLAEEDSDYGNSLVARWAHPDLVEAVVRCGHIDAASALVRRYEVDSERASTPWTQVYRHLGRALVEDCAQEYLNAKKLSSHAHRPFDQARIALLHGEWLRRNRRQGEARFRLQHALKLFEGLGAVPWADRARTQLRAARGAVRRSEESAGLTGQELQIAQLAATGMTNKEIGAQLVISPRTVSYHLYKLFPKLGISSRAQLRALDLGQLTGGSAEL